jgi:hypothetical protein
MSLGNTTETDLLALMFNATALSWNAVTQLDLHLHTADPGEAGTSSTSEATYGSYALVTVNRNSGGFTVSGNTMSNTALVQFPQCTSGSNTITHVSITPRASTQIIASGALSSSIPVSTGIRPQFEAGQLTMTMD